MGIIGIDPGVTGALCLLEADDLAIEDMPVVDGRVNPYALSDVIQGWFPGIADEAVVEALHAMPKNGSISSFKLGQNYGTILGVLAVLKVPVTQVSPQKWTRTLGVGADKEVHRRRALETWPSSAAAFARKKDQGRADAALIALWGDRERRKAI